LSISFIFSSIDDLLEIEWAQMEGHMMFYGFR